MSDAGIPIPPATFEFLVFSLKTQAELHLGLMSYGESEQQGANLPAARHAIDLLAMLVEKTRGNLSIEEQRMIENSITELRFRFVQARSEANAAAASAGASSGKSKGSEASGEEAASAASAPSVDAAAAKAGAAPEPDAAGEAAEEPEAAGEATTEATASDDDAEPQKPAS